MRLSLPRGVLTRMFAAPMQAFESGPRRTEQFVVVMGGLTDGLLPCGYVPPLAKKAAASGWATVQAVMRGSCERDLLHTRLLSR